jgi:ABC-type phosphate transport system substrate-binding protein
MAIPDWPRSQGTQNQPHFQERLPMTAKIARTAAATAVLLASATAFAASGVDPALPDYTKASGVSGNISSVGSDTLANLMTLWAEDSRSSIRT